MLPNRLPQKVIFDFDNTLVDTQPSIHKAFNDTLEAFGHPIWSDEELSKKIKFSPRDFLHKVIGVENEAKGLEIFLEKYKTHSKDCLKPLDLAHELISFLSENQIEQYIISNKRGFLLRHEIENILNWSHFFAKVIGSEDFEKDKPDPAIVEFTIGHPADRNIWFVGDTDVDVKCAKLSGCYAILVNNKPDDEFEYLPDINYPNIEMFLSDLRKVKNA